MSEKVEDLQEFLSLEYEMKITPFNEEGEKGYVISCPELPGISVFGETIEGALEELQHSKEAWFLINQELGRTVKYPKGNLEDPSGRLTTRFPIPLHKNIIEYAENSKTSINTAINFLVTEGLYAQNFKSVLGELEDIKKLITNTPSEVIIKFENEMNSKQRFKWEDISQLTSKGGFPYHDGKFKFDSSPFH